VVFIPVKVKVPGAAAWPTGAIKDTTGSAFSANGLEYQDVADLSWFARQKPSIGLNGPYSFLGTLKEFSSAC
jgi:hypothetical protein